MEICDEVARIFNLQGFQSSAAALRQFVGTRSGKNYFKDGSQQDSAEFLVTLLREVQEEISVRNWEAKVVIEEFWGLEKSEKKYINNPKGICNKCDISVLSLQFNFYYKINRYILQ